MGTEYSAGAGEEASAEQGLQGASQDSSVADSSQVLTKQGHAAAAPAQEAPRRSSDAYSTNAAAGEAAAQGGGGDGRERELSLAQPLPAKVSSGDDEAAAAALPQDAELHGEAGQRSSGADSEGVEQEQQGDAEGEGWEPQAEQHPRRLHEPAAVGRPTHGLTGSGRGKALKLTFSKPPYVPKVGFLVHFICESRHLHTP
jgi:hypothetical protein